MTPDNDLKVLSLTLGCIIAVAFIILLLIAYEPKCNLQNYYQGSMSWSKTAE